MSGRAGGSSNLQGLDDLIRGKKKNSLSLSPNDALVQIALPLVLILAIITRLMVIEYTEAMRNKGPRVLEMWKQQLILRMDTVMNKWEKQAELGAFPDFSRVQWKGAFPVDERFKSLCARAQEMDNRKNLEDDIYNQALAYTPPIEDEESASFFVPVYDPDAKYQPKNADKISDEFVINEERRAYAMRHIADRVSKWKEQVEGLQWAAVAQCADKMPLNALGGSPDKISTQLTRVASEMNKRGYPLMNSVVEEYGKLDE
ncbi:hypothetical protein OAN13_07310 [Opitutales bacterium]|nr:hypothetical protein [Opitutales bacterium]